MPFAVPRALPLSLLAALVLAGCAEKGAAPLKKGEKPVDVASVVRQKMPASVKDRNAWADALAKTFESQKIAPTEENICSVLAVAQQESMYQSDPVVPGLNKIAWKEIDRRAESMHIPVFLVHTALKITSPNGKSYSERLDTVKTEKQLSAIFDDFINMVPMGQKLFGSLNPVHTGGPMQVSIAFAEKHTDGYPWKIDGTVRQEVFSLRGGLWFGTYHLLNYPANYMSRCTALPTLTQAGMPAVMRHSRVRSAAQAALSWRWTAISSLTAAARRAPSWRYGNYRQRLA
jgi:hypothetical protein